MREVKVKDLNRNGYYWMMEGDDFEYSNPIEKISEMVIKMMSTMLRNHLEFAKENNLLPSDERVTNPDIILERVAFKNSLKIWEEHFNKIMLGELPEGFLSLLENKSKKEQEKILKGLSLTNDELMLFIFKAWQDFKFTYSMYTSSHNHNRLEDNQMPTFAYKDKDNHIISVGRTELTDGQIKNAIDHRTVIISKFLDRGEEWCCFFFTFKSLKGEENYKDGQPHLHFISDKWGLSREYVLQQLKSKEYKLPRLPHIDYHTHRNPRNKK